MAGGKSPLPVLCSAIIERGDGQVLIARRPTGDESTRLWEFPTSLKTGPETPEAALRRTTLEKVGLRVTITAGQPPIESEFAGRRAAYRFFQCSPESGEGEPLAPYLEVRWIMPGQLCEYDFVEPHKQVAEWYAKA